MKGTKMKINLLKKMKAAEVTFSSRAEIKDRQLSETLADNRSFLMIIAGNTISECRLNKGSDLLPGLFEKCLALCEKSVDISEDTLSEYFKKEKIGGVTAEFIPLAMTCALNEYAAKSIREGSAKRLKYAVDSLRILSETDFDRVLKRISLTEKILLRDPTGVYEKMSEETKKIYRRNIALKAMKNGKSEEETAEDILKKAEATGKHTGEYILGKAVNPRRGILCIVMGILMPFATAMMLAVFSKDLRVAFFSLFPLWEIFRIPVERAMMKGKKPKHLPRMKSTDCSALITVSTLLPSVEKADELKEKLEQHYLGNGSEKVKVCCLADFKSADSARKAADKRILESAKKVIAELNEKHGSGFILAVRPRSYSETQNEFIGKERKRGAITELIRAIKGDLRGFTELFGDTEGLGEVKYLMAADWDTEPYFGAVQKLLAVAEHPLNCPVVKNGRVVSGYGLFVPEVRNSLRSKFATGFTKLMAGDTGFSSYDSFACEKYQLLFGESVFGGKGLINVDAYYETLNKALPREKVLSHDTVESGYLRAAYVPESQFAESFPETVEAYFRRMHRWVRGDFQNVGFIFGKNPLNTLSRYKIFDNMRRDMHAFLCVSAMIFSAFIQGDAGIILALISAFSLCCEWVYSAVLSAENGFTHVSFSGVSAHAFELVLRAFVSLAFAVKEAYICIDAAAKALWRLFVSGNNLLEWETSSNTRKPNKIKGSLPLCIPSAIVSAVLIVFGLPLHRLAGIIFLADVPLTLFSGAKADCESEKFSQKEREYLLSQAKLMWGFFDDFVSRENNFLPPDNVRFSPSKSVCRKTSPTNIGFMLISFLAARDFGYISSQELCMRLGFSLSSIEKLEKFKGNLLNWYSTETLETLSPRFVSTVDSGNFLCCLTALKEGLKDYVSECGALKKTIRRIEKIIEETDLSVLYNSQRKLFCIGLDPDSGEKTKSCYDLFMSEMRMTSYFAVARGVVSQNHWSALGRIGISRGRYRGLASWTGTMFEYFMPEIFLPSPKGSLSKEALMFCVYCQKKRAGRRPFGISESCYYDFDKDLNYRYKAHGVSDLAIKSGLERETVVSPYSSFLTLTNAPKNSVRNLMKLEKAGVFGKYGFYEAVDFSNGVEVIRSFMAHHVGMSFLSVANALDGNRMQRRFMNDMMMKGAKTLLDEKIPSDFTEYESVKTTESHQNHQMLRAVAYSNGKLTQCFTCKAEESMFFDGINIPITLKLFVETEKEQFQCINTDKSAADFGHSKATFEFDDKKFSAKTEISVAKKQNSVNRLVKIENKDKSSSLKGKIRVSVSADGCELREKDNHLLIVCKSKEGRNCFLAAGFPQSGSVSVKENVLSVDFSLNHAEKTEMLFVVSAGENEEAALKTISDSLNKAKPSPRIFANDSMLSALSEIILSEILSDNAKQRVDNHIADMFGVTGDNPILTVKAGEENTEIFLTPFLRINKTLRSIGIKNDLLIIFENTLTRKREIEEAIKKEDSELMVGVNGGIHLAQTSDLSENAIAFIRDCSCFYLDYEAGM